ncbi:gliding motility-associated C-terminal domain-containing protein [Pedobacter cryotolerans]|uniref:T9SS type B sorting domain-containing protein n=1 Tax=Pedobacter cryotolerans TaxID=2571270 RepID=A0A4U1C2A6_9SPHI|nr:gliding motility-associated C-terminal domain-containing protein [Pedobacter cryotolerans]TKB99332.1 T9SS type B sorting domain-containing protein [Pedobacter cryotolerans]
MKFLFQLKKSSLKYFIILILLNATTIVKAQVCSGTLGDPVINIDFGRGTTTFGPQISETNYRYVAGTPDDGWYTIVKTSAGLNSGWHQNVINRTPNDPNGYFMLVNANNDPGVFYQTTVSNLCPNTTYEFAAWVINILRNSGVKPKIRFTITNNGLPIAGGDVSTGEILEGSATNWIKYGTTFKTPVNVGTIALTMTNENPGGVGNDLGIDDITFRPCGPNISSTVNNSGINANLCAGESGSFNLSSTVSSGYNDPVYQWQEFIGNNWVNIAGETTTQTTRVFTNAQVGLYQYRLAVAENGNINSANCRVSSATLTINVNAKPTPIATNSGVACEGSTVQLNVDQGVSFVWTGPNSFSSTLQNPQIPNVTTASIGTYQVTVTSAAGCVATTSTPVNVLPVVNANINITNTTICENQSVNLVASGGTTYTWLPTEGLSNSAIANPIASPQQTTKYTVNISNGACSETREVTITVLKNANANAGDDKKMLVGQSVVLEGAVSGDNITYLWSPIDYLDDPTKLNPIANPPTDITYTLTVQSSCNVSTDDVFVKVYPKIEIPNTFTPNGDGVNDTWNIPSISAFEKPKLQVINRNGQLVYETRNTEPWDGKSRGKNVPVGVYYYNLYLNEDFKLYSGWVMLTR